MMRIRRWAATAAAAATVATLKAEEWTEFRGPSGQGISTARNLPLEWSASKNVAWKQPIPGEGWSSPLMARGRIFLTTGLIGETGGPSLRVLCLDAATGRVLWQTEVFKPSETNRKPLNGKNTHASATPLLEGDRLYAHFGHNGTAALDLTGKILWRNNSLGYDSMHGNGGSPIVVDDKLVFNEDGASDPCIVALEKATGRLVWKTARETQAKNKFSFCTPLFITVNGRPQIISPGSGVVYALDPADGREIWRVRYGDGFSVTPRPVFGRGLVFVCTGFGRADILAIRPDGQGDVTDTHVVWRATKGAPLTPSLLLAGEELYAVSDAGLASCFDAATGTMHWQERVEGNYSASPVSADGRLYLQSEQGTGTVLQLGRTFSRLAVNPLGERSLASYAVTDGALFIRTAENLYRVANER